MKLKRFIFNCIGFSYLICCLQKTERNRMGTRTNFYKTPSLSYKKDLNLSSALQNLKAYNIATGNAPLTTEEEDEQQPRGDSKIARPKRQRIQKNPQHNKHGHAIEENDEPMSHLDYINKRR